MHKEISIYTKKLKKKKNKPMNKERFANAENRKFLEIILLSNRRGKHGMVANEHRSFNANNP